MRVRQSSCWPFFFCTFSVLKYSFSLRPTCLFRPSKKKKALGVTVRPPIYCCLPPVCPTWRSAWSLAVPRMCSLRFSVMRPWTLYRASQNSACKVSIAPSERLLPSMRNTALALITSHDQDHSVVSGWNWQAGFSLTLSKWARWEVLPRQTVCVSTTVVFRSFQQSMKKVGPLS